MMLSLGERSGLQAGHFSTRILLLRSHDVVISTSSSSPLLSLVTSTSEISHQPAHTYTTYIYDKGVDRTGRQGIKKNTA